MENQTFMQISVCTTSDLLGTCVMWAMELMEQDMGAWL